MTSTVLIALGTPNGSWVPRLTALLSRPLGGSLTRPDLSAWHDKVIDESRRERAESVSQSMPQRVQPTVAQRRLLAESVERCQGPWGGIDVRASRTVDAIIESVPEARFLAVIESPAESLAAWLDSDRSGDPEDVLGRWAAEAASVVRAAHAYRTRFLVVLAREIWPDPDRLLRRLEDWLGIELGGRGLADVSIAENPLKRAVAALVAERNAACSHWFEQLRACSAPLAPDEPEQWASRTTGADLTEAIGVLDELSAKAAAAAVLEGEVSYAAGENELLRSQLHHLQRELERYYLRCREGVDASAQPAGRESRVQVARVDLGRERDTPPHRELSLTLRGVRAAGRTLELVDLRLVEHHGQPGLTVFAAEGSTQTLLGWRPNGSEAGRDFMLLMPGESTSSLARMGTSDWLVARALADAVASAVTTRGNGLPARWRVNAVRLVEQLAYLPARFRYDNVEVERAAALEGTIDGVFVNAMFGDRLLGSVRLRWWPGAARRPHVDLLLPEGDAVRPMLACWPVGDDGHWQDHWPVPLSGDGSQADWRLQWTALCRADRESLLALLDALPALARRAAEANLLPDHKPDALVEEAGSALQLALRAERGSLLRRVARVVRGV